MSLSPLPSLSGAGPAAAGATPAAGASDPNGQDRFLKMLVAQMKNQDPLNPMDNAQVTSQMAQINAVVGIERVNASVQSLLAQLTQGQALQGAALVGREVLVEGDTMRLDAAGTGRAAIELAGGAERVSVEVLGPGGQVLDTLALGALGEGRHHFAWRAGEGAAAAGTTVSFRVTALSGTVAIPFASYARETVGAVAAGAAGLELDLADGRTVPYSKVRTVV